MVDHVAGYLVGKARVRLQPRPLKKSLKYTLVSVAANHLPTNRD
jgi:hypothetical protein